MKFHIIRILTAALIMLSAGATLLRADGKDEFIRPEHEWEVTSGKPCMVVFEPDNNSRTRTTFCIDGEGELKTVVIEELDRTSSRRPVVFRTMYIFNMLGDVVGAKTINYINMNDGSVEEKESISNNLALVKDEQVKYRDFWSGSIIPEKKDSKGNWIKGIHVTSTTRNPIKREITYYGDGNAAEKKALSIMAEADSLMQYCKDNAWTIDEKDARERKSAHGFWWNLIVPALVSIVLSWLSCKVFYSKRSVPNYVIMLLPAALAFVIGEYIIIPAGPYGHLWTVLYWIIAAGAYGITIQLHIYGRCPRCGSASARLTARRHETKTTTKTAKYPDGREEVLEKDTEKSTTDFLQCEECGYRWKHFWFGHM